MKIPFKKMHGTGNDFILIQYKDFPFEERFSELAEKICHRHFGIGADGLLIVNQSDIADFKMQYYNSDGSVASMCGNGIRCFSKFVYDEGFTRKDRFTVETLAGLLEVSLTLSEDEAIYVSVHMGKIIYDTHEVPVTWKEPSFINEVIETKDKKFIATTVRMGVPHTVIFTDHLDTETVKIYGPLIEKHPLFPEKTNVNFAKIRDRSNVEVKTWERGAGYTLACGTGVSSVVGVAYKLGFVDRKVHVHNEGGSLIIEVRADENIFMDGPAKDICAGVYFV